MEDFKKWQKIVRITLIVMVLSQLALAVGYLRVTILLRDTIEKVTRLEQELR